MKRHANNFNHTVSGPRQRLDSSILIKDLVSVLQNSINNLNLPSGILDRSLRVSTHERGTEDDGQVVRVHAVDVR